MELKKPDSMDECLYFTNRSIGDGYAVAWVYRKECPKCKKARLGKPLGKTGKPDKKSPVYECPSCKHQETNGEVEADLQVEIEYQCPHCQHEGQTATEYKRRSFEGVKAYVFECGGCRKKTGITKKLADTKKKK